VLDNGIVAATVPGKNLIALFQKSALNPLILDWNESTPQLVTQGDISALDTVTIGGQQQLVYVAGNHLYLQATSGDTTAKDLGIVGTSQAIAVGNLHSNLNDPTDTTQDLQDIAVADYNQNLHVFSLDAAGKVTSSQTSKINTKPRDITIFDWNKDGFNDILIADGSSGLDIKINQLKPVVPSTIPTELLDTKFEYDYVPGTDRITQKTEFDTVRRVSFGTTALTRKTVSEFDNLTGNLTSIKVFGTDNNTLTPTAETTTHYNLDGTIDRIEDALHHVTQYTYFDNNLSSDYKQVKSIERGNGTSASTTEYYTYYDTGYIKDVKDGNGNVTHYDYDPMNRQIKVSKDVTSVDPTTSIATTTQNITTTEYYQTGWVKSVADANNHQTSYTYDGVGRILTQTAADGGVTTYEYDPLIHNLKSITDPVGRKTSYEYYDNQQIKDVITDALASGSAGALSTTTHYEYNPTPTPGTPTNPTVPTNPQLTTTVTPNGQTPRITVDKYDRFQRLIESTNPIGTTIKNEYFDDGTIKSSTVTGIDSFNTLASHQTQFKYDPLGRQNEIIDALGNSTAMVYDLVGNLTSMTDANGHITSNNYDSLNRKTQTITPVTNYDILTDAPTTSNLITQYQYDKNSNLISITDAQGRVITNTYDELNRRTTSTIASPLDSLDIPITTSKLTYDGVGNIIASTDANNHTTYYGYDAVNRQNKVTDALGKVTSQKTYDKVGRVISSKNLYGETTTSAYNDVTHVMTMTNSLGTSTQTTDAFGNIISTTNFVSTIDAVGRTNIYKYDKLNRQTKVTDYRGGVVTYSYDGFNNLLTTVDASGNAIEYQYDALNRRVNTKDSLGQISSIVYDNVGNKIAENLTVDTGKIRKNQYQYDELNRQYSMTTAVGAVSESIFDLGSSIAATTWTSYDKVGNIVGTKDALGRISTSTYDKLNRQTSVTQAVGTVDATTTSYKYDKVGNRIETIDGRSNYLQSIGQPGYSTKYQYDELNRQIQILDPYQISDPINDPPTKTEYFDAPGAVGTPNAVATALAELALTNPNVGKVIKTTDAYDRATYVLYDKFDRQIETYDATKHRTSASKYDAIDRVIGSTDTFGKVTTYTYQDAAKKKLTLDPFSGLTTELFDVAGNLTDEIDSLNRLTHYNYDKRNRQTKITDTNVNHGETKYTYYNDGQSKSIEDAVGNITTYFYDRAGRLIQEKSALGNRYYQSDLVNNRTQGKDRNGRITKYDYDDLNRIKSETWVGDGQTFTYTYDQNGNRLTAKDGSIEYDYSYDRTDLLERVDRIQTSKPTVSFVYEYDNVGNLTTAEELVGTAVKATTVYEYDSRNLNTKITQTIPGLAEKEVRFTYDPITGLNTKIERYLDGLLKLTTTNAFDLHGRLVGIKQENSAGTVIGNDVYELDILDRLQTETKQDSGARSIGYDHTDQVTTVTGSNSEGYTYDKNGNRTGGGYVTGAGNRLMSDGVYTYDYDAEGNRTKRTKIADNSVDLYTWDYRNRLKSIVSKTSSGTVTQTVGYEYDVDDQRVKKTVDGVVENYYIDRDQIAVVTDGGGNQTFHYLYGLNVDSVLAQDSSTGMVWALADRLGSVDTLTDGEGVVVDKRSFDSFGRILSETNPSVSFLYGYTGRERDLESGLDYYRARYYDPAVGRFISVDPMGFEAGDTNLYRYVSNSSTNYTDPTGEFEHIIAGALIGGVVGGVLSIGRQFAKMADGGSFDVNEVGGAIVGGAIFGGLAAANPLIGLGLGGIGAGFGIKGGIEEIAAGQISTGVFDIATSAIGLFGGAGGSGHFPGLNNGSSLAFAGSSISAVGAVRGAGGGAAAESLFSHFFAMSNGDGNSENQGQGGDKGGSRNPLVERVNQLFNENQIRGDVSDLKKRL
jgi:RHS repeat-associated protein